MALKPGQEKCIRTLDRSIVVAAGAGSGKTFTLTKRIVHAIQSGAVDGIHRVCAITFTNKAAGELKSRIKAELRSCGLSDQALQVDEAWVSTIHGMCARILRSHAVELDIDPAFAMADAEKAGVLRERAIDAVLSRARSGQGAWADPVRRAAVDALFVEYPARTYGPRGNSVESMMGSLMEIAGASPRGFEGFVVEQYPVNPAALVQMVLDAFEGLAGMASAQRPNEAREAWAATVLQQVPTVRDEMAAGKAGDVAWALGALDRLPLPKRVGTADFKEQVSLAIEQYRMCVMELRLSGAAPHLRTLVDLAREAARQFAAAKRAEGVLDNNDLLVLASRAIEEHPEIAAQYTDRFQLVMVDEFQDTDQMQVDMIKKLAGPGACRLCTVGDAQQSIYRFRGADVAVYRRHLREVRAGNPEDVIMLPDNFRSHADVLALVDRVFEQPDMFGGEFMSLAPGRDEARVKRPLAAGVPRVQVQLTSNSYRGATSEQVRHVAAERIADAFADLRERGHSAGEMAVLLGSMTYADVYARALRERGLACVIAGGSVFSRTPEALAVRDFVRALANPYRTSALYNVLAGPLFELCADDFVQLCTCVDEVDGKPRKRNLAAGLRGCAAMARAEGAPETWSAQLALAVRVMGDALSAAGRSTVARIAMRAVVDSGWLSRLQGEGAEGLARAANALKAIRMVESIESSGAAGPSRVMQVFEVLLEQSNEAPGALSATGGDFVRIMTVHASKGLEFPIVAVGEFKDGAGRASRLLSCEHAGRVYLSLDLQNTVTSLDGAANLKDLPGLYGAMVGELSDEDELLAQVERAEGALERRAALYEYERVGDVEESKRLLYVALTRAKEALVVSCKGKRAKDNPGATPKSCLGAIVSALAGPDGYFEEGRSTFDYRGSAPAVVEHVALQVPEDAGDAPAREVDNPAKPFVVPQEPHYPHIARVPFAPAREGVFSYSSIAEASHEGDVLQQLAARHCVSVDAAGGDFMSASGGSGEGEPSSQDDAAVPDFSLLARYAQRNAVLADEDEGSWAYTGATCADDDKATDLGTAFHRLAQYACAVRKPLAPLAVPPVSKIDAQMRSGMLDGVQRLRLERALDRWFASTVAREAAALPDLAAEVPFFVQVPGTAQGGEGFLEGEIDLLGMDARAQRALVVDYKTGGNDAETEEQLSVKHVLQAACYAYAIMQQGVREVDAVFVRVERPNAANPDQPQCVRYHFAADDLPELARAIATVHAHAVWGDDE